MMGLLRTLKPEWWFSAHLHCRFEATVLHPGTEAVNDGSAAVVERNPDEIVIEDESFEDEIPAVAAASAAPSVPAETPAPAVVANPDEIVLDDEEEEVAKPPPPPPKPIETKFLALDKCLPRRQFLEVRRHVSFSRSQR